MIEEKTIESDEETQAFIAALGGMMIMKKEDKGWMTRENFLEQGIDRLLNPK